nr:threonine-phosphate decarboxylase CobD [uncultured Anaeromusa sp.]
MTGFAAFEHGGNIYTAASELGVSPEAVLDFSANINPLGLPPGLKEHLASLLDGVVHYPEPEAVELRQALAESHACPSESVIVGNGAAELLYLLCYTRKPRRVLVTAPTFSEYEKAARAAGAEVAYLPLTTADGFALPWEQMSVALADADIFFLCNPNNPTGTLLEREAVLRLAEEAAKEQCFLLVDESFQDFLPEQKKYSILQDLPKLRDQAAVLRSLTKFYAIPGLRLGFMAGDSALIQDLTAKKDTWNVNFLAQQAGLWALRCSDYQQESRTYVAQAKQALYAALAPLPGVYAYEPAVNYILLDMKQTGLTSSQWRERLKQRGILVRDCANYVGLGDSHIRVAVRRKEENERLMMALAAELAII